MKHIRKNWRRFAAVLLSAALMISTVSQTAFAAGADTGKAIQFVDGGTAANISGGQASSVYFGTYPDIIPTLMKAAMYIPTASAAGMEMSTVIPIAPTQHGRQPMPCLILLATII